MTTTETASEVTTTVPYSIEASSSSSVFTVTIAPDKLRRQQQSSSAAPSDVPYTPTVPTYPADFCDASLYSAVCSSWGFTPTTTTVTPTVTVTESPSPTASLTSGVLQAKTADGTVVGYVVRDANYWTPLFSSDINQAIIFTFEVPPGATQVTNVDFSSNDSRGTYFAPVAGRDTTNNDIAAGSFHYLDLAPTSETAPAGSAPQSIPSYFTTTSGLTKGSETAVWSVDLVTSEVTIQWVNTDGTPANTILFMQSNHLYAGGDPAAFQARFPATVAALTLTWIPL